MPRVRRAPGTLLPQNYTAAGPVPPPLPSTAYRDTGSAPRRRMGQGGSHSGNTTDLRQTNYDYAG